MRLNRNSRFFKRDAMRSPQLGILSLRDRPMPDATPAVRSSSPASPAAIVFLHSATARSSLRSTQIRSPYSGLQLDEGQFGKSPLLKSLRSKVLANLSVPYVPENRCIPDATPVKNFLGLERCDVMLQLIGEVRSLADE